MSYSTASGTTSRARIDEARTIFLSRYDALNEAIVDGVTSMADIRDLADQSEAAYHAYRTEVHRWRAENDVYGTRSRSLRLVA